MGWAVGFDPDRDRHIGYGVPATCDYPSCGKRIDRGVSYACGDGVFGTGDKCGLFFCTDHLSHFMDDDDDGGSWVCERCANGADPFDPTPDLPEWARHVTADESWSEWRDDNPRWADDLAKIATNL